MEMEYRLKGWPAEKEQVDELAREYWNFREELNVEDGMLFTSNRIVVPRPLIAEVLDEIHGAHMGESKSLCEGLCFLAFHDYPSQRQSHFLCRV